MIGYSVSNNDLIIETENFKFATDPWALGPAFNTGWWLKHKTIINWKDELNTCDFIYHMGTGLLSTPIDGSVNTAQLASDAVTTAKVLDSNITTAKVADDAITNAKIANESITINGSAVALGGSVTVGETKPTITSTSLIIAPSTPTSVTIAGTNFASSSTAVSYTHLTLPTKA